MIQCGDAVTNVFDDTDSFNPNPKILSDILMILGLAMESTFDQPLALSICFISFFFPSEDKKTILNNLQNTNIYNEIFEVGES